MGRRPLYREIAEELKKRIADGRYPAGSRIPGHVRVAREFGVSPITSNRALQELLRERLIERHERAGSFVRASTGTLSRVSLIVPFMTRDGESQHHWYMQGCLRRSGELGHETSIYHVDDIARKPLPWLRQHLGDGMAHLGVAQASVYALLEGLGRPLVVVGCATGPGANFVLENRRACTRDLVRAMAADGCRTIGFVGNLAASNHRLCRDGYLEGTAELNLGPRFVRDAGDDTVAEAVRDLLAPDLALDAIVVAGGHLPIAAMPVVLSTRPDVRLGCVHESAAVLQLSSVAYVGYFLQEEVGRLAIDVLADLCAGRIGAPGEHYPPYRILRPGESLAGAS
ncbi:MAG: GntR family transcriptional regulator [Kiritimatiellae bacterium]|nr:GntR family transcriptional regulator [Kiritimatiellia bacterium]